MIEMKKILFVSLLMLTFGVRAQNGEVTERDVLNLKSCYEKFKSHDLQEKSIDVDGEIYNLMSERDFARENIMVSDKEELQKLADLISYETVGVKGKFGRIIDWKSMNGVIPLL